MKNNFEQIDLDKILKPLSAVKILEKHKQKMYDLGNKRKEPKRKAPNEGAFEM